MMTEELRLKITADTSGLKKSLETAKKNVHSVGSSTKVAAKASNEINVSFDSLAGSLDAIKGMQFWTLLTTARNDSKDLIKQFKNAKRALGDLVKPSKDGDTFGIGDNLRIIKAALGSSKNFEKFGIELDTDSFSERMSVVKTEFGNLKGNIISSIGQIKTMAVAAIGIVGKALALITPAVFIALGVNAIGASRRIKELNTEAAKIGLTANQYGQWGYVLQSVGIEADNMKDFIKTLSSEQLAVVQGNEDSIASFGRLGLSMEQVSSMSQGELFAETIRGLQGIENAVEQTSLAYKIFGEEDAANVANLLRLNSNEVQRLIQGYQVLGGGVTQGLVNNSMILQGTIANLGVAWTGLKNTLAAAFLPVIIAVVNWVIKAVYAIRLFIATIFGVKSGVGDIGKTFNKAGGGAGGFSNSLGNVADTADTATKAVQKLKRETMGFDELNRLPGKDEDSGSDGGGGITTPAVPNYGGGGVGGFDMPLVEPPDLSGITSFFEKYKGIIRQMATWVPIAVGIGGAIISALSGNILGAIGYAALAGIGIAVGIKSGAFAEAANFLKALLDKVLGWVGAFFGIMGLDTETFMAILEKLKKVASIVWDGIKIAAEFAWEGIKAAWSLLKPFFEPIWEFLKFLGSQVLSLIGKPFQWAFKFIKDVWIVAGPFFSTIWEGIKKVYSVVSPVLSGFFKNAWAAIKAVWSVVGPFFQQVWNTIKGVFSVVKSVLSGDFRGAWEAIKGIFSGWGSFFNGLKDKVFGAFHNIAGKIGSSISGTIKSAINSVLYAVETKINQAINLINKAIKLVNKLPGVEVGFVGHVNLPRLAKGGITTGSMVANIGEAGREAVLPLENNTEWMDTLANKIAGKTNTPSKIVLAVDGKELGYATINSINGITRQTGTLQLNLF